MKDYKQVTGYDYSIRTEVMSSDAFDQSKAEQPEDGAVAWVAAGTRPDTGEVIIGPSYDTEDQAERYANIMRWSGLGAVSVQALYPAPMQEGES